MRRRIMEGGRVYEALRFRCLQCGRLVSPKTVLLLSDEVSAQCKKCGPTDAIGDWKEVDAWETT